MPREMIFLRKPVPTQRACDVGLGVKWCSNLWGHKEQPLVCGFSCELETIVNFA